VADVDDAVPAELRAVRVASEVHHIEHADLVAA